MIDKAYSLFVDSIPDYKGKICVAISGGLDSRLLAGLVSKKRKIDLAYTFYRTKDRVLGQGTNALPFAAKIAKECKVDKYFQICVDNDTKEDRRLTMGYPKVQKRKTLTGLRKLNGKVKLKDYTVLLAHGADSYTGVEVNPLTLFSYKKKDEETKQKKILYEKEIFPITFGRYFKDWDIPLWNDQLVEFFLGLPFRYRFQQNLYRKMIIKYFPELAKIPREDIGKSICVGEFRYLIDRAIFRFNKWMEYK